MEVYVEYVIVDNLVITALICLVTYRILRAGRRWRRVFAASVVGTVAAVFYPFMRVDVWALVLVKLGVYVCLSVILFAGTAYFFKGSAVFLAVTALMGGIMFMAGYIFFSSVEAALTLPFYNFSIGAILLVSMCVYFAARKLVVPLVRRRIGAEYVYKIEFSVLGKTFRVNGFLDSGNMLFDEPSGLPVVVVGGALTSKILSCEQVAFLMSNQPKRICDSARLANFGSLGGMGKALVIKPQNFRLYLDDGTNILKEVMLGLSFKGLKKDYDALISPSIL